MFEQVSRWRRELIGIGTRLEKRYSQKRWSDGTRFNIEKDIFVAFFAIRKLLDGNHVDHLVAQSNWTVTAYPALFGANPSPDPKTFAKNYELSKGAPKRMTLREICNQFIHAGTFSPFVPFGQNMVGIFFSSDWDMSTCLHYLPLVGVMAIVTSVGKNRVVTKAVSHDGTKYVVS